MNRATRIAAAVLGAYAGLLGAVHGYFETRQGDVVPRGFAINAIGAPCQPEAVWHACLPAMTVVPNLRLSGLLAIAVSLLALLWAIFFLLRRRGGLVLIGLAIAMLFVGAGFVAPYTAVLGGVAARRIHHIACPPLSRLPAGMRRVLGRLWPWTLFGFVAWSLGGWVVGHFFNQALLDLGALTFLLFDVGLPLLTVLSALAHELLPNRAIMS